MAKIEFFTEDINFKLSKPQKTAQWIAGVCKAAGYTPKSLSYIFCSDAYLHTINVDYLSHDTLTDIITFDNSENSGTIEADIFISIERVRENAAEFKKSFYEELHRVMIHGVLHLLGQGDKTKKQKIEMRQKEDACLSLPSVPRETWNDSKLV